VEFFTRTGITAAGGQFDFDRYTRKMFVHRSRKRNLLVLLYLTRKYKKKNANDNAGYIQRSADFPQCFRLPNFIFIPVAYPEIFFGGVQQIQLTEGRENRDLGAVAP
jgi:hypothetical protein